MTSSNPSSANSSSISKVSTGLLFSGLLAVLIAEVLINLTPPITRDALIHHLAIPKLWLQHGGIYEIPWADFSYYTMNVHLLYLACLALKNDILPKFIHMAFGLGTGWMIFSYLRRKYNAMWGMLGSVIFLTTPIVIWLSASAYIDLGMTFFTTASILSFTRWRESNYDNHVYFMVSAVTMGIALGTKYNALIAWFITNMIIMVIYIRDEEDQIGALKFGILFGLIAVVVASPWYVRNLMLTGNPFFPLFKSFFNSLQNHPHMTEAVTQGIEKSAGGRVGFFKMREVLYGETFWETLAIPIRMFFQGDDNSYQYFQGRLNPILIVFLPFAFISGRDKKNNLLFVIFSLFFMIMAFFLTAKQVRYQLPVLPFLAILAVVGLNNLDRLVARIRKKTANPAMAGILAAVLYFAVAAFLIPNLIYAKHRFETIAPIAYITGKETKSAFLTRHLRHYKAVVFINENLPENANVFTIYWGRRGYYLERTYFNHPSFGTRMLKKWVNVSGDEEKFIQLMDRLNATHIAMRTDLVDTYIQNNFSREKADRFLAMIQKHWHMIYNQEGYSVWEIKMP